MSKIKGYYPNGQLRYEHPFQKDKLHGVVKGWWGNGQLMYRVLYQEGKGHGVAKGWKEDGEVWYDIYYLYGREVTKEEFRKHELIEKLAGI